MCRRQNRGTVGLQTTIDIFVIAGYLPKDFISVHHQRAAKCDSYCSLGVREVYIEDGVFIARSGILDEVHIWLDFVSDAMPEVFQPDYKTGNTLQKELFLFDGLELFLGAPDDVVAVACGGCSRRHSLRAALHV